MKRILQILLLSMFVLNSMAQTVTTWTGNKTSIGNSNNVALASALWAQPHSICADPSGNIWVSDDANHCIKLIRFGQVYNRVGSQFAPGTPGSYGYTNALSSAAQFNTPRGIVCDATGKIYVADYNNNAIRVVDAFTTVGNAQAVITLCGAPPTTGFAASGNLDGVGTNARFYGPSGICIDNSGNLYVTDENNNNIRKIAISTGTVTTLCGNASGSAGGLVDGNYATAKFKYPRGISFSASENALYVCDFGNSRIRKIDLTAQTVTVYLGSAPGNSRNGFMGNDGNRLTTANSRATEGIVLDYQGNIFFTSSSNAHTVRRIEKSTGNVLTLSGQHQVSGNADGFSTAATFNSPTGMMLTPDKTTMYVCDNINGLIRSIDLRPLADFHSNYTALATGAIATLTDTSLSMVTNWNWTITPGVNNVDYQFTNSTTATSQNPQVKFLLAGTYTVKDSVNNAYGGNAKTRASYIVVSAGSGQPTADFIADQLWGYPATIFKFTNQTTNNANCTYFWSFLPSNISYLDATTQNSTDPHVRFTTTGLYSVTLNVAHPTFTVSPKVKTNYIKVTNTGIHEVQNEFLFNIFPNPNQGNFKLITTQVLTDAVAEVIDMQGRVVAKLTLLDAQEQAISLPALNSGIYFMKIIAADKVATQRVVIE